MQGLKASAKIQHYRFIYVNPTILAKTAIIVDGVILQETKQVEKALLYQIYYLSRALRQISYRLVRHTFRRFRRIYFNLIQLPPIYNRHKQISHFYIEGVRFYQIITYKLKPEYQLAINQFIQLMRNQQKLLIKAFYYNNELSIGRKSEYSLISNRILIYYTPLDYLKINGYIERSGSMIIIYIQILC